MGGLVARAMVPQPGFALRETFGSGYVHKLITIATPHLGTPLALALLPQGLADNNACTRSRFNSKGDFALQSVVINGVTVPAGVGDLSVCEAFPIRASDHPPSGGTLLFAT